MFPTPRIGLKPLAQLCRRLAVATGAGLEDRRIWRDEAARGGGAQRAAVTKVSDSLARGNAIGAALEGVGDYFPKLFRQIVAVGDNTGQLDRTYRRLAEHYEQMLTARRTLLGALAWPAIQLAIAVATIGLVIWFSSAFNLKSIDGQPLDLFGLGLTGGRGLTIYLTIVMAAAIALLLFVQAWSRGMLWTRQLQRIALQLPGLGNAIQTLALARLTWALQLVLDTPMDLRKALPLAFDATGHESYRQLGPRVVRNVGLGMSLHNALAETAAFPPEFLDALEVGEQSGMLAETMERQSREYQQRAVVAIGVLARLLGGVIWVLVAVMLIVLIFRVFGGYISTINELSKPGGGM